MEKAQKGRAWVTVIIVAFAIVIASTVAYLGATKIEVTSQKTEVTKVPVTTQAVPASDAQSSAPAGKKAASELVSIDADWNLYTNNNLGFSMKVPKMSYTNFNEWSGDHKEKCVSNDVIVISDDITGRVYIGPKSVFSNIQQKCYDFTFDIFDKISKGKGDDLTGALIMNVTHMENNVSEINALLTKYGNCKSNGKIFNDGRNSMHEKVDLNKAAIETCSLNQGIFVNYSVAQKKLAICDLGQNVLFIGKGDNGGNDPTKNPAITVEDRMFDSFKFTNINPQITEKTSQEIIYSLLKNDNYEKNALVTILKSNNDFILASVSAKPGSNVIISGYMLWAAKVDNGWKEISTNNGECDKKLLMKNSFPQEWIAEYGCL